jgi:hypothetical protein
MIRRVKGVRPAGKVELLDQPKDIPDAEVIGGSAERGMLVG